MNAQPEVMMKRKKLFRVRESDGGCAEMSRANKMKSPIHDIGKNLSEVEGSDTMDVEDFNFSFEESSHEISSEESDSSEGLVYEKIFELVKNNIKKSVKSKKRCARISKKSKYPSRSSLAVLFSRCNLAYFHNVIDLLSDANKEAIHKYGFGCLLDFKGCSVPWAFVQWIVDHIDINCSDLVVGNKCLPISPESVHLVLGIPYGGVDIPKSEDSDKLVFLSLIGEGSMPTIKTFGSLVEKKGSSCEEMFRAFMVVALPSFLYANSSAFPSTKYVGSLMNVDRTKEYNWSKYVYEWFIKSIIKYKKQKLQNRRNNTLGGCIYFLAVYYLDFLDFGLRKIPQSIPRISIWHGNMVKEFSSYDSTGPRTFGCRPVKDITQTCYQVCSDFDLSDFSFRTSLESSAINSLPCKVKDRICDMVSSFGGKVDAMSRKLGHDLVIDVLECVKEASYIGFDGNSAYVERTGNFNEHPRDLYTPQAFEVGQDCPREISEDDILMATHSDGFVIVKHVSKPVCPPCEEHVVLVGKVTSPTQRKGCNKSRLQSHQDLSQGNSSDNSVASRTRAKKKLAECSADRQLSFNGIFEKRTPPSDGVKDATDCDNHSKAAQNVCIDLEAVNGQSCAVPIDRNNTSEEVKGAIDMDQSDRQINPASDGNENSDEIQGFSSVPLSDPKILAESKVSCATIIKDKSDPQVGTECGGKENPKDIEGGNNHVGIAVKCQCNALMLDVNCPSFRLAEFMDDHGNYVEDTNKWAPVGQRFATASPLCRNECGHQIVQEGSIPVCTPSPSLRPFQDPTTMTSFPSSDDFVDVTCSQKMKMNPKFVPPVAFRSPNGDVVLLSSQDSPVPTSPGGDVVILGCRPITPFAKPYSIATSSGSSFVKPPHHCPKRYVQPNHLKLPPFSIPGMNWNVSAEQKKHYQSMVRMSQLHEYMFQNAVDIDKCCVRFDSFGKRVKPRGEVDNFLLNCYVRKLFNDFRPAVSKKHFFFHKCAECWLEKHPEAQDFWWGEVRRAFNGAHSSHRLYHSDVLYFPSLYLNHWFLFVVDIKESKFVFLDSMHSPESPYHSYVRGKMIPNFITSWFDLTRKDMTFSSFEIIYPAVPKQDNNHDCGFFVMKFMDPWNSVRDQLVEKFSTKDMPNIRIKLANDLLFSVHNNDDQAKVSVRNFIR